MASPGHNELIVVEAHAEKSYEMYGQPARVNSLAPGRFEWNFR